MVEALASWGAIVERQRLLIGDYLLGERAIAERKRVMDLHTSLKDGRLWLQVGALRTTERWPYLIVEGTSVDSGPLGRRQVRGALLRLLDHGVRVIRTESREDSACWMALLAATELRHHRRWRPHRVLRGSDAEAILAAVPGISAVTARALLDRFGSVSGLIAAGRDAWLNIPGVGPQRAAALEHAFMPSWPQAAKAQARDRAT